MSVVNFELKPEHVKLLKNLRWCINKENIVSGVADEGDIIAPPFGETNLYEAMDLILNGKPENVDLLTQEEFPKYSSEQKVIWDKLYSELPLALDVIFFNNSFEIGMYKTRYHERNWQKIK